MSDNFTKSDSLISVDERKKRKREGILAVSIIAIMVILTYAETQVITFGTDIPISNTVLMFILININLLLLILLMFLVFRNIVKLIFARRRKILGAKLRTKLVLAFITLSLLPTIVLFFFSIHFITSSIEFWFNVPVEQSLDKSLLVGRELYKHIEENNKFFIERVAYQIKTKKRLAPNKIKNLSHYILISQREFHLHGVEVYDTNYNRITFAIDPVLENKSFEIVSADDIQKDMGDDKVITITQGISSGELIRTIGTVPFGVKQADADAFVVISILISPELSKNLSSITRGVEEYQQIKLLKKTIQIANSITPLSIVALLVIFCAVWYGLYLAKTITIPIMKLAEGTRRVAEGDLSFNMDLVADDEVGILVDSFNIMTSDLRKGREQLELSNKMLSEQRDEIEERRQYMEIILTNVSAGVISFDASGKVTMINKSAEKMLNIDAVKILGKDYEELLAYDNLKLAREVMDYFTSSENDSLSRHVRITIGGKPLSFSMNINALKDDTGHYMGLVVVFDDMTELERAERKAAWREVARRIAHEVKNPLTPITLSAQRLKRKYSKQINNPVFEECTSTIIDHVDLIRNLVNEFSRFARFPSANPKPRDLLPIVEETVALYREGHPDVIFEIRVLDKIPELSLDRQQIKQALINLVDNAIASLNFNNDDCISFTLSYEPSLEKARLIVADTGSGISDKEKSLLFEPYFSTKKTGMGLGLTIVSTIINDHKGTIFVEDNSPRGVKFIIEFPVEEMLIAD
ncbi:MAG: PAS domain S-box protein [Desulfobacterales bacterium]|nr:PAS domain S-box protein [Desulfobacterales bacterium]